MAARWTFWKCCVAVAVVLPMMIGCGGSAPTASISTESSESDPDENAAPSNQIATLDASAASQPDSRSIAPAQNLTPEVIIKTSEGDIKVRLNAEKAPATVDNFLSGYVDRGFYTDTIFHHVDPGYVMAGGYTADLTAKEVRAPVHNESTNGLKNIRGTITMSRPPEYIDGATSQFFINVTDAPSLDYDAEDEKSGYCVFGNVVKGMDVIDRIAKSATEASGDFPQVPVEAITILSVERID